MDNVLGVLVRAPAPASLSSLALITCSQAAMCHCITDPAGFATAQQCDRICFISANSGIRATAPAIRTRATTTTLSLSTLSASGATCALIQLVTNKRNGRSRHRCSRTQNSTSFMPFGTFYCQHYPNIIQVLYSKTIL